MSSIASMRHRLESRTEFLPDFLAIRPQIFRGRWLQVFASNCLPFVFQNVTIFLLFRPGSEKPSAMLLSPWRRSQVVRQRSAKPPSPVRIRAAPLTDRTRPSPSRPEKTEGRSHITGKSLDPIITSVPERIRLKPSPN